MSRPVWILTSFSGSGGVEKLVSVLANGMAAAGREVHLVLVKRRGPFAGALDEAVRVHELKAGSARLSVGALTALMREHQPETLLVAKERSLRLALAVQARCGYPRRIVFQINTHLSRSFAHRGALIGWWRRRRMARLLARCDELIAVSQGVADDVRSCFPAVTAPMHVHHNPIVASQPDAAASPEPSSPLPTRRPLVLAMGRLTAQKGFDVLLRAYAGLPAEQRGHLMILGDGAEREALLAQADELGIAEEFCLPGFVEDPRPILKAANLFVLSSRWEGFGNALVEAMALGVPVVSCDCPSGPSEILEGGKLGPLVPVDDVDALRVAMVQVLQNPLPPQTLIAGTQRFTVAAGVAAYLNRLG